MADIVLAAMPGLFPDWPAAALVGLALGQVIVAAAWMALGRGYWLARSAVFPLAAIALAHLAAPKVGPSATEMMGVLLFVGAPVAVLLAGARIAGLQIEAGPAASCSFAFRRYSLANLFVLTTVVAVYAAISRETSFPAEQSLPAALHCCGFVAIALALLAMFASGLPGDSRLWLAAATVLGAAWGAVTGPIGRVAALEAAFLWTVVCVLLDCECRVSWARGGLSSRPL
jgi:hypothetical protein